MTVRPGDRIAEKWQVRKLLGRGGFGEVYMASDDRRKEYAIKVEARNCHHDFLRVEKDVYKVLAAPDKRGKTMVGVPRMHFFGKHQKQSVLVLDRLGPSLDSRLGQSDHGLSLKTCLIVAVQAIRRLEHIHRHGFVHRDIKPANMLTGNSGNDLRTIYIVDFGACKRFRHPITNEHIPWRDHVRFIGTARFASIKAHQGVETSRRDDLESLGYTLLQLSYGRLPWQGLGIKEFYKKHETIVDRKKAIPLKELCKGFPGMRDYLTYVRSLEFDQEPNYSNMRGFFRSAMRRHRIVDDGMFDWLERI